jgi:hypothetical protein
MSSTELDYWLQHPEEFKIPVFLSPENTLEGETLGAIAAKGTDRTNFVYDWLEGKCKFSIRNLKIYNRAAIEKAELDKKQ